MSTGSGLYRNKTSARVIVALASLAALRTLIAHDPPFLGILSPTFWALAGLCAYHAFRSETPVEEAIDIKVSHLGVGFLLGGYGHRPDEESVVSLLSSVRV